MTPEQRKRFLPKFVEDDRYHLAFAGRDPGAGAGWCYHRPLAAESGTDPVAVKQGGDWVINGTLPFVANAPVAKLFAVAGRQDRQSGFTTLLVPRDTPGLTVREPLQGRRRDASAGITARAPA